MAEVEDAVGLMASLMSASAADLASTTNRLIEGERQMACDLAISLRVARDGLAQTPYYSRNTAQQETIEYLSMVLDGPMVRRILKGQDDL